MILHYLVFIKKFVFAIYVFKEKNIFEVEV